MTPASRAALAALSIVLSACAATKPVETHLLRLEPVIATSATAAAGSLSLAPVLASGAAGQRAYLYIDRAAPAELRQAKTLMWDEPPPRMAERALVEGLHAQGWTVAGPDAPAVAPLRVVVRLERFEELEGGGEPAAARAAFHATILAGPERRPLADRRYCGQSAIAGATPSDRVQAFQSALNQAVLALAADLKSGATAGSAGSC